jgi:predicted dehydrogenase
MSIGVALIGTGKIALANHVPGVRLHPAASLVAVCDPNRAALEAAERETGARGYSNYKEVLADPKVDAVIIATPNFTHEEISLAACAAGKHVLCEKPLALDYAGAMRMLRAAESAGVRHMTAFTYRFVPAMRYLKHLVDAGDLGPVYHFRAQRFQDWDARPLGWRQVKKLAGTGEMGDMLSHRIDYAHLLVGPTRRLVADLRNLVPTRGNEPSDVDDWVALLAEYGNTAHTTGVLESTKLATGRGEGHGGQDLVELNGAKASLLYSTQKPLELQLGHPGDAGPQKVAVPREFLVYPGSPRDPAAGDPLVTFRYDQDFEFIQAILDRRACSPSFAEGAATQRVMDAAVLSAQGRRWVDVSEIT